jgi:two-component system chemotaxis sensor kinase CheA
VEAICQACESVLSRITQDRLRLTRPILARLQEATDGVARLLAGGEGRPVIEEVIERLEGAATEPAPGAEEPPKIPVLHPESPTETVAPGLPPADTIRVGRAKLDALLLQAEDLLVPKLAASERVREARALIEALTHCRADRAQRGANGSGAAELESGLRAVEAHGRELLGHLVADQRTLGAVVDGLMEGLRRARMTPASTATDFFPRMVRDLADEQGKEVEWVAEGTDLEVDRKVLEAMKDPLIHLVRNAIDHGIEPPEARSRGGKPPRGRIAVTIALLEGNRIEIRVEDDGVGIDPAGVRAAAIRGRLLTAEQAAALTDDQARDLIYRSGLSTSPMITDVSGHGLGLAIVKERVERLGGQIRLETRTGVGTTIRMVLPASIATFHGLLVRAGGQPFLLPTKAVERALGVTPEQIERVEGQEAIRWDGPPLPVARLSRLLGLPEPDEQPEPGRKQPCVIVRAGEDQAAFVVEEILGDREVLVKELGPPLIRVRNIAGAGLLGTGQVVLILRPTDLLKSFRESPRPPAPAPTHEEPGRQAVILVVDDSITTRTMEKNLLEAAGFQVRVAVDGIDAWTVLKSEKIDLVVSDVDMPRMDGLDLTSRIRADQKLKELPVVLVTALESREDKERGIEVGANAYIVKSSFEQSNILEIMRRLL